MVAPQVPPQTSLDAILVENSFTLGELQSHPLAVPFAAQFDAFQVTWGTTNTARIALQIAASKAEGAVSGADDALDDFVDTLDRTLLIATKNDRGSLFYQLYFGLKTANLLKRPILGDELATVRNWVASLAASTNPALAALAPALVVAVAAADAAIAQKAAADQALKDFDMVGGKKTLLDVFNALRQSVYGDLAALPHQNPGAMLPATFADRFYRHVSHKGITSLTNPKDVQTKLTALEAEVTAAQNHLANLTAAATALATAKAAAVTAEAAAAQAKQEEAAAKQKVKDAEAAAKAAKKKAKK